MLSEFPVLSAMPVRVQCCHSWRRSCLFGGDAAAYGCNAVIYGSYTAKYGETLWLMTARLTARRRSASACSSRRARSSSPATGARCASSESASERVGASGSAQGARGRGRQGQTLAACGTKRFRRAVQLNRQRLRA
eukprot:55222-Rhodomonas_salina.2